MSNKNKNKRAKGEKCDNCHALVETPFIIHDFKKREDIAKLCLSCFGNAHNITIKTTKTMKSNK